MFASIANWFGFASADEHTQQRRDIVCRFDNENSDDEWVWVENAPKNSPENEDMATGDSSRSSSNTSTSSATHHSEPTGSKKKKQKNDKKFSRCRKRLQSDFAAGVYHMERRLTRAQVRNMVASELGMGLVKTKNEQQEKGKTTKNPNRKESKKANNVNMKQKVRGNKRRGKVIQQPRPGF